MRDHLKIIDAHSHIFPSKIAEKAVAGTDQFYGAISFGDGTVEGLLEDGKKAGVDKHVVCSVATTPKQVASINRFIAESVKGSEKLIGLGSLHPGSEDPVKDLENLLELALHGVKLHPDIQSFPVDDPRMYEVYAICEKKQIPVLIHAGDHRYDFSNPDRIIHLIERYPDLKLVCAHFGGWSVWPEAEEKFLSIPGFHVDSSSTYPFLTGMQPGTMQGGMEYYKKLISDYGPDRVLFGVDFPMFSVWQETTMFLKALEELGFSDQDKEKMLFENAEEIYCNR